MSINLELVVEGPKQTKVLSVHSHVNKYLETIVYSKNIQEAACPLDYYENKSINSENNMFILDKSFLLDGNLSFLENEDKFFVSETNSIISKYKDILVTNIKTPGQDGNERPLFYRHDLPTGVKEVDIEISTNMEGRKQILYKVDKQDQVIYTNGDNYFDPSTGKYCFYFVITTDHNGNSERKILSLSRIVKDASWEDIDLETGKIKEDLIRYSVEKNNSGYSFKMNKEGPWYWIPTADSTISLLKPETISHKDNWNIRVKNGEIKTFSNGKFVRYWIPEFNQQAFNPYIPYNFVLSKHMEYVNEKTLSFTHKHSAILPEKELNLEVMCYDENDNIVEIYTTDKNKAGQFYRGTEIQYRVDSIESWDNKNGIVVFNEKLRSNYTFYGNYFSELKSYEMKEVSFNPLQNQEVKNYTWVIYCIPNLDYHEKAIHFIAVDKKGIIRHCSQTASNGYPNFQIRNSDGSFNQNTAIGLEYKSSSGASFAQMYSNLHANDYQYLILGEVYILEKEKIEDSFIADVRERKRMIREESLEKVFHKNPRILQSVYGYGENGQEYSRNNSLIYQIPITVLKGYGGDLTESEVMKVLEKTSPSSKKNIVDFVYKEPKVKIDNSKLTEIKFIFDWDGPQLKYNIYRKEKKEKEFELLEVIEDPQGPFEFVDKNLENKKYFYSFSIEENNIEYPRGPTFTVIGDK